MKFLRRLATGEVALWRTFWLVGTPLALLWDVTGICMVLGIGVEQPVPTGLIIGLFSLASLTIPFAAVAIWRSASNYPRTAWWHTPVAWGAKLSAVVSGVAAGLSVLGLIWLGYEFIEAILVSE